ncbi:MAG: aminotransferase [Actinomycetota bacterium]
MRFSPTITDLMTSPISAAHALVDHRVNGRPMLDVSQAAPSYPPPQVIVDAIAAAAGDPSIATYAPQPGLPRLRSVFADDLANAYAGEVVADDVLITAGCNQAFCIVASALAGPGDNMLIQDPFYFNHGMWLDVEGIEGRRIPNDEGLVPNAEGAAALIDDRTTAIVLVTPGNPTGVTVAPERIREFAELASAHDLALIVDETYRSFRPTEDPAHALFADPAWRDTVISLHSFSKDLAIPGYRVGAVVAGETARLESLKILDCVAICAPPIGQVACIAGLEHATEWRREQAERIATHQQRFESVMATRPGGFELVAAGAYFGWVRGPDDTPTDELLRRLVVDHDVLAIPGTAFTETDEHMLRLSFANLDAAQIDLLGERLAEWPT